MIPRSAFLLLLALLLLQSGCTALHAVTAPGLAHRLPSGKPIRMVTPLATVYSLDNRQDASTILKEKSIALGIAIQKGLNRQLTAKGWQTGPVVSMDWRDMSAGKPLPAKQTMTADRQAQAAVNIMRQLDEIGHHLRDNERLDGIGESDQRVAAADSKILAGDGGSLLFAVVIGCDGRLTDTPCREIQSPPFRDNNRAFGVYRTLPAGIALHLYWLAPDNGQLLWYDTACSFNADPFYSKSIATIVAETMSEFPSSP